MTMTVGSRPLVPSRLAPGGVAHGTRRAATSTLGAYVALTKPRIIELLLITTVPTMVVAERGWPSTWLVLVTLVGGTLAAGGANAINMYVDRDIDKLMERTRNRPLVTGAVAPRDALVFAIALEILAFAVLWAGTNLLAAALALSATAFYVGVYTLWLKRTSRQNIVIGGASGAAPSGVLIGPVLAPPATPPAHVTGSWRARPSWSSEIASVGSQVHRPLRSRARRARVTDLRVSSVMRPSNRISSRPRAGHDVARGGSRSQGFAGRGFAPSRHRRGRSRVWV